MLFCCYVSLGVKLLDFSIDSVTAGKDAQGRDLVAEDGSHGVSVDLIGTRAWHISGYYSTLAAATAGFAR